MSTLDHRPFPGATRLVLLALALGFGLSATPLPARAALILQAGHHSLQPWSSTEIVRFYVENTGAPVPIAGLNFNLQIEGDGPLVTAVDLITGTPFEPNHETPSLNGALLQAAFWSVVTSADTVLLPTGRSLLATATFSTPTLVLAGMVWPMTLDRTLNGPTQILNEDGDPLPLSLGDGSLRLATVPDDSQGAPLLPLFGWLALWAHRLAAGHRPPAPAPHPAIT